MLKLFIPNSISASELWRKQDLCAGDIAFVPSKLRTNIIYLISTRFNKYFFEFFPEKNH